MGASLVVLEGPNRGAVFSLLPDVNRMGRDPASEVVLVDDAASRLHAEVRWEPPVTFRLVDAGSRNGTRLNGLPCREAALRPGDEVRVGETTLLFVEQGAAAGFARCGASTVALAPVGDHAPATRPAPAALEVAPDLVGSSPAWLAVLELAARVAPLEPSPPVLILGETGTGKELLARALHRAGARRAGPFVAVNAATFTGQLVLSELFGHERGAFTGAVARRAGCLERAHGGTLFLDEVGELPLEAQALLLRALETGRYTRVGGAQEQSSNFRLLTATHRDLAALVAKGAFRGDLLYRLDVVRFELPALRDREGDVEVLAEHFVRVLAPRTGSRVRAVGAQARAALRAHPFPGNVRELRNVIERALLFAPGPELTCADLPVDLRPASRGEVVAAAPGPRPVVPLHELERRELEHALRVTAGNKTQAALLLEIDRKTLYAKLERHGLDAQAEA